MKPLSIFASPPTSPNATSLWAICYPEDQQESQEYSFDIFRKLLLQWNDIEWLRAFFNANLKDLQSGFRPPMKVNEAIRKVRQEVSAFEKQLKGIIGNEPEFRLLTIDNLFEPYHEEGYFNIKIFEQHFIKGRPDFVTPPMLRLYGLQLPEDVILITGGAIKLTQQNNRAHLIKEEQQMKRVDKYMKDNNISNIEDFF